jgi:di/tricarboxylate transporter
VIFVIATFVPINIGALAFVAAFVLGSVYLDPDEYEVLDGFPAGLAVTLIGITYLFAIAQNNGTIDWLVGLAVRAVRGRIVAIPWIMFAVAAALTAVGAVSPAAVAIIAPVALGFAYRYGISPLMMGLMVIHGAQAGGFSPISIYGSITNGIVEESALEGSPLTLFLASLLFNLLVVAIAFTFLGGPSLLRRRAGAGAAAWAGPGPRPEGMTGGAGPDAPDGSGAAAPTDRGHHGLHPHPHPDQSAQTVATVGGPPETGPAEAEREHAPAYRAVTLLGLVGLAVGTLLFDLDVGLTALTVAVVLALVSRTGSARPSPRSAGPSSCSSRGS